MNLKDRLVLQGWRNKEGETVMDMASCSYFFEQFNSFPLALNLQAPPAPNGFLTHVPASRNSPEVA